MGPQYHLEADMAAAAAMRAEAERIGALVEATDSIVASAVHGDTWVGTDANEFRNRWATERDKLVKTRADLLVCADELYRFTQVQIQALTR